MPSQSAARARFRVAFDDATLAEDLQHSSPAGRNAAYSEREHLTRDGGIAPERLKACEAEGTDATRLPGCAKIYIPEPNGPWGMVFQLRIDERNRPYLACLAFGVRHPTSPGALSVYEVADRRLNA
jgi:hypothetical protein